MNKKVFKVPSTIKLYLIRLNLGCLLICWILNSCSDTPQMASEDVMSAYKYQASETVKCCYKLWIIISMKRLHEPFSMSLMTFTWRRKLLLQMYTSYYCLASVGLLKRSTKIKCIRYTASVLQVCVVLCIPELPVKLKGHLVYLMEWRK